MRRSPDLAVEVISPGDTYTEVAEKVDEWLNAGCAMVWVVNPRRETVEVHRSPEDMTVLRGDDILEGGNVIEGSSVRLGNYLYKRIVNAIAGQNRRLPAGKRPTCGGVFGPRCQESSPPLFCCRLPL